MTDLFQKLVTILDIDDSSVTHTGGISHDKDMFPDAKIGQEWMVTFQPLDRERTAYRIIEASLLFDIPSKAMVLLEDLWWWIKSAMPFIAILVVLVSLSTGIYLWSISPNGMAFNESLKEFLNSSIMDLSVLEAILILMLIYLIFGGRSK